MGFLTCNLQQHEFARGMTDCMSLLSDLIYQLKSDGCQKDFQPIKESQYTPVLL